MFVPEYRGDYRVLFERYCRDAVRYVLDQTGLEDPCCSIETLDRGKPDMADDGRIKAFLVNNVAKEFISTHLFSNPDERQVKIDVRGRLFIGEIGSLSSGLIRRGDGTLGFVRDRYTIWQNNARNPYNALIPPMEETLHIALRHRTEKAVLDRIHAEKIDDFDKIRPIASQWLAVEAALAGGVVHQLAPSFFAERTASLSEKILEADLETKNRFEKYRYLKAGIALVERLGVKKALKMYNEDPTQIEKMLF